jgi:hypothetical protein
MVALVDVATTPVETEKVADVAPAGIVTVAGTVAEEELELKLMEYPPLGAALPTVTVPVEEL